MNTGINKRPKQDRFYLMNDEKLVYVTRGRTNMMVTEDSIFFANHNACYKDEIFVECACDVPYPFLKKYLCFKHTLKISWN
jgi:hypothetical protein